MLITVFSVGVTVTKTEREKRFRIVSTGTKIVPVTTGHRRFIETGYIGVGDGTQGVPRPVEKTGGDGTGTESGVWGGKVVSPVFTCRWDTTTVGRQTITLCSPEGTSHVSLLLSQGGVRFGCKDSTVSHCAGPPTFPEEVDLPRNLYFREPPRRKGGGESVVSGRTIPRDLSRTYTRPPVGFGLSDPPLSTQNSTPEAPLLTLLPLPTSPRRRGEVFLEKRELHTRPPDRDLGRRRQSLE